MLIGDFLYLFWEDCKFVVFLLLWIEYCTIGIKNSYILLQSRNLH